MPTYVSLARTKMWGKTSMVITLERAVREHLNLLERDVVALRLIVVNGKPMVLGQKVPLNDLAKYTQKPLPAPTEEKEHHADK